MLVFIKSILLCFFLIIDYSAEGNMTLSTDYSTEYEYTTLMISTTVAYSTSTETTTSATLTSTPASETTTSTTLTSTTATKSTTRMPAYSNFFKIPFVFS